MKPEILQILKTNTYLTLATICHDGSPYGTPLRFAYDETKVYWLSLDETIHSQNIARDGRVFITVFNSQQNPEPGSRGAVYIRTIAHALEGEAELAARNVFADRFYDSDKLGHDAKIYSAIIGEWDSEKSQELRFYMNGERLENQGATA